jgi:probable HAF family extracellular repeat protein
MGLLLLAAVESLSAARAQEYSVAEIPSAAGQSGAPLGIAINATGTVTGVVGPPEALGLAPGVGDSFVYPAGIEGGATLFEYSAPTTTNLGSYDPNFFCNNNSSPTVGTSINASGEITGEVCATTETPTAFSYDGTFTLVRPSQAVASFGDGINTKGQIVGTALFPNTTNCSGNLYHPFIYSPGGAISDLELAVVAAGGCSASGAAINDAGDVSGVMSAAQGNQGFIYHYSTNTAVALPELNYSSTHPSYCTYESNAQAINASDQITGAATEGNCGGPEAFLYTDGNPGTMKDIGNLGGLGGSEGNAINSGGQITGVSYTTGNAALHAFLYTSGSPTMVDLNSLIPSAAAAAYVLEDGVAINDSGEIVVLALKVATGQPVTVLLTPASAVPNVVGDTQAAAISALTTAGFQPGTVTTQASTTVAPGIVISQDPAAGSSVSAGSLVSLVISTGVSVPNVVGLPLTTASTDLSSAGLTTGSITQQYSGIVAQGTVISQSPAAGVSVAGGTAISVVVSEGLAPTQVPNVIGDTQAAAAAALTGAELTLGTVGQQASATVPAGEVISQSPIAGNSVAVGSAVNLILSVGPAQVSVVLGGSPQFMLNGGGWTVAIPVKNNGNVTADVTLLSASLNGVASPSADGLVAPDLAPGTTRGLAFTLPLTVTSGTLKLSGSYTDTADGLAGNWSTSARVSVPAVP